MAHITDPALDEPAMTSPSSFDFEKVEVDDLGGAELGQPVDEGSFLVSLFGKVGKDSRDMARE
ncbi:MAG TPA: hypothetical protein VE685_26655 [Thermoanaerobaculia bacterium]|nr:hypothetical protein [Thermoanaerobaculia bacterium]